MTVLRARGPRTAGRTGRAHHEMLQTDWADKELLLARLLHLKRSGSSIPRCK